MDVEGVGLPKLALTTRIPRSAAYVTAAAASVLEPVPLDPSTLRGTSWARHATPATPRALLPRAAMMPATWVPWREVVVSWGSLSSLTKSQPRQSSILPLPSSSTPLSSRPPPISPGLPPRLGTRSGCSSSTPESITPTRTPGAPPVVTSQAGGAPMVGSPHCSA